MTQRKDDNRNIEADNPARPANLLWHNPFVIWMTKNHEVSLHGGWSRHATGIGIADPNTGNNSDIDAQPATAESAHQQAVSEELQALLTMIEHVDPDRDDWQIMTIDIAPVVHQPPRHLSPRTITRAIAQGPDGETAIEWNSFAEAARVAIEDHHQWQTATTTGTQSHMAVSAITHSQGGSVLQLTLVPPPLQTHAEPRRARLILQNGRRQMTMHLPATLGRAATRNLTHSGSWSWNNIRQGQAPNDAAQDPGKDMGAILDTLRTSLKATQEALHRIMSYNQNETTKGAAIRHLGHMALAAQYLETWFSLQTRNSAIAQDWRLTNPTAEAIREWINSLEPGAPHHEMTVRTGDKGQMIVQMRPCSFPPIRLQKAGSTHHLQQLQRLSQMMPELAQGIAGILQKECSDHEHI